MKPVGPAVLYVQMLPFFTVAANLYPSLDDAIEVQRRLLEVCSIQVEPESLDVQMLPPYTTAANLVPSLDDAIEVQLRLVEV